MRITGDVEIIIKTDELVMQRLAVNGQGRGREQEAEPEADCRS